MIAFSTGGCFSTTTDADFGVFATREEPTADVSSLVVVGPMLSLLRKRITHTHTHTHSGRSPMKDTTPGLS